MPITGLVGDYLNDISLRSFDDTEPKDNLLESLDQVLNNEANVSEVNEIVKNELQNPVHRKIFKRIDS